MEKGLNQHYVDIITISFQNDDFINSQLENMGKLLVALQPKSPLHSVVYPISEANSSTLFRFLVRFNKNR